jgi:hypothetical protein
MGTDKTAFVEVVRGGATGSDVTGSHVAGCGDFYFLKSFSCKNYDEKITN